MVCPSHMSNRAPTCQDNDMSVILESLLDDERRAECLANDRSMAMGRPIIASQSTMHPVHRISRLHPARSELSNVAPPQRLDGLIQTTLAVMSNT
jgi:hypothetical protein